MDTEKYVLKADSIEFLQTRIIEFPTSNGENIFQRKESRRLTIGRLQVGQYLMHTLTLYLLKKQTVIGDFSSLVLSYDYRTLCTYVLHLYFYRLFIPS